MNEIDGRNPSYYRWKSEMRVWGGDTLQARIVPFAPDWFRIDRWSCTPIEAEIPVIDFRYPRRAPKLDLIFSSSTWEPYSSRLRSLLTSLGANFEEFPCRLLDAKTGEILSDDYAVVHFLGCCSCFDWERSEYDQKTAADGSSFPSPIRRLHLAEDCLAGAPPIFRLSEARHVVLASDDVRAAVLSRRITGVRFLPLEDDRGF